MKMIAKPKLRAGHTAAAQSGSVLSLRRSSPDPNFCVKLLDHPSQFAARMLLVFATQISECAFQRTQFAQSVDHLHSPSRVKPLALPPAGFSLWFGSAECWAVLIRIARTLLSPSASLGVAA